MLFLGLIVLFSLFAICIFRLAFYFNLFPQTINVIKEVFNFVIKIAVPLGLLFQIFIYWRDSVFRRSETFLNEIINNFNNAINLISYQDNSNTKWHAATNSLRQSISLAKKLKINEHKEIYVMKYLDTLYKIVQVIMKIDHPDFFSGVTPYKEGSTLNQLRIICEPLVFAWSRSNPVNELLRLSKNRVVVSCAQLCFLVRFLGKGEYFRKEKFTKIDQNLFEILSSQIDEDILTGEEIDKYAVDYPVLVEYIKIYIKYHKEMQSNQINQTA